MDYVIVIKNFLNPISGSKVTALLLMGWILPIGGVSAVEVLQSTGIPRLVSNVVEWGLLNEDHVPEKATYFLLFFWNVNEGVKNNII